MKLFIDTNIWIYYLSSKTDLDSVKKLRDLVKEKKVELVAPKQMYQEYLKHSPEKIEEGRNKVSQEIQISIPDGLNKEGKSIIPKIESINKELKELSKENIKNFESHIISLESIIDELFLLSTFIEDNDEILEKAEKRFIKNLPPKKDGKGGTKKGDAIIWETLKMGIPKDKLSIIAKDSDYCDVEKGEQVIKRLLKKEWEDHTGGKTIVLYTSLGAFINTIEKKKTISDKIIEKENNLGATSLWNPNLVTPNSIAIFPRFEQNYAVTRELPNVNNIVWAGGASTVAFIKKCAVCGKGYSMLDSIGLTDIGLCNECRRIWNGGAIISPKIGGI